MSVLHAIRDKVQAEPDLEKAKQIVLKHLAEQTQNKDMKRMAVQVQYQIFSHDKLIRWIYNAILAHEGLATIGGRMMERS